MRCTYCRSITHDKDCPKELEDRILPIYTRIHKLGIVERRATERQQELYALAEAVALRNDIKRMLQEFITQEGKKQISKKE